MNLPDYVRALNQAAERFEKAVAAASEQYREAVSEARNTFFEDDDKPMAREDYPKGTTR